MSLSSVENAAPHRSFLPSTPTSNVRGGCASHPPHIACATAQAISRRPSIRSTHETLFEDAFMHSRLHQLGRRMFPFCPGSVSYSSCQVAVELTRGFEHPMLRIQRSKREARSLAASRPLRPVFELIIALALIALNGLFSLSELAVVSARKVRLKTMADAGRPGARMALALAEDPGRFLSTVQIGITLVGILAGAFSGAALGERLQDILAGWGMPAWLADPLGYGLVIAVITYLSVVMGELVPKHLALRNTEAIACAMAPPMVLLSRIAGPVVWLLDASTKLVFRIFGQGTESASAITDEEIKTIVAEAETAGVIETDERKMISGVLRLGDRAVRGVMTPRTDVDWIDLEHDEFEIKEALIRTQHSRLPVCE